ncbi:MAG: response regulator [Anaerolineae bacterium]|nr:response regulator [Anaerolineae bacterium]
METKVLVIDDEVRVLETFARTLGLAGYAALTAGSGPEGLAVYASEQPDVVMLDMRMPGMDGLEVLHALRTSDPEANVIVVTGHGDEEALIAALRAGASDFLPKPINTVALESAMRRAEERVHLKQKLRASQEELRQHNARLEEEVKARTAQLEREIEERTKTEQWFREIYAESPIGIELYDADGLLIDINAASMKIFGVSDATKAYGLRMFNNPNFPHDAKERLLLGETVHYETAYDFERVKRLKRYETTRSGTICLDVKIAALGEDKSTPTGYLFQVQDITAQKRTQEAMHFQTLLLDQIQDMVTATDLEGNIIYVNEAEVRHLRRSRAELLGQPVTIYGEDPARGATQRQFIENTLAHGEWRGEIVNYTADGEEIVVDCRTRVMKDAHGQPTSLVGIATDITERVRVEAERERLMARIQEQARQMKQILANVPEGMLLLDADGRVALANPAAQNALAALADQDAIARRSPILHLGDRPLAELLAPLPDDGLWHAAQANGRIFEIAARPMDPAPGGWVLLLRDVTHERQTQRRIQQQERLAAVGQLAAGIAHDFNNILAVITLYTQMALNAPDLSAKTRERLGTVAEQARQASALIQQILDFSRQAVLERQPVDVVLFLKGVVALLGHTVPENIRLNLSYGEEDYTVNADPTRIQQVILNLALNARDAMPEGGEVRIEVSRVTAHNDLRCVSCGQVLEGEWVRITVTDTGTGIAPDVLPHIFEPFFTTKEVGQGVGLGLPQVYGIVKKHGGHIDVATQVGEWTTFTIYLPALLDGRPPAFATEAPLLVLGRGETILVVEDDAVVRQALVDSIALLNYRVLEAAHGREALHVLEQHADEVALVLSDLVMPEMGGQALFHAMRQRGLSMPVVVLSGHPIENDFESLRAQGLSAWMLKPPSIEHMSRLLAQTLQTHRP